MSFRRNTAAGRAFCKSSRVAATATRRVRQQVIATLGRFEELQASGQLSGCCKAMVLSAASDEAEMKIAVRRIRPALVFERLWEEAGCREVITGLAGKRRHGFALERAVFLTVVHRLFVSGSDRRVNAVQQLTFFRQIAPGFARLHWDVNETGWPYACGGVLKRAIAGAAALLGGRKFSA